MIDNFYKLKTVLFSLNYVSNDIVTSRYYKLR